MIIEKKHKSQIFFIIHLLTIIHCAIVLIKIYLLKFLGPSLSTDTIIQDQFYHSTYWIKFIRYKYLFKIE